jgi:Holliday junction resolvasome RuvABC ATP-dependent DNA helicase subunit
MSEEPTRHISPQRQTADKGLDGLIRPQYLAEFTGQEKLKTNLSILYCFTGRPDWAKPPWPML